MVKRLVEFAVVAALGVCMASCGDKDNEKEDAGDSAAYDAGDNAGEDAGDNGGSSGGPSSDLYLTCKLNGESVRIDGLGSVVANYQVDDDETVVQTGGPQKYRFLFVIPGKTTGNWELGDHYLALSITDMNDMTAIWESSTDQESKGAALQVGLTSYGSVGDYIDGTFSGTAVKISDDSKLVITDGEFHASRIADI